MAITIYFGKLNLVSEHIYKVYDGEINLRNVLLDVLVYFNSDLDYEEENTFIGDDGEQHTKTVNYSLLVREKTDTYIRGRLDKTSRLYYKETNPITKELQNKSVVNTEAIEFYFDVFNEMVGYNTSNRFGYKKFLEVFSIMINKGMEQAGKDYRFTVDRFTYGIDIASLEKELKEIEGIQKLKFSYQPANPDSDILASIQENGRDKLEEYEEANLSSKSVLLTTTSKLGLNLNAKIIKEQLLDVNDMQRNISVKEATKNGYIKVEAMGRDGITWSTEDKAPVKKQIFKMEEFQKACEEVIRRRMKVKFEKKYEE